MSPRNIALAGILLCELVVGCASGTTSGQQPGKWRPIGSRKARVVHWGVIHNHSQGKWDAVLKLTNDYEMVGWVDDTKSTAMRMQEPNRKLYEKYPRFTPQQVFEEVKPDLIVVECSNSELVEVSTEIARIIRGEIPNPPGLYRHDLLVHKVSLDACNLKTEDVK